MHPVEEQIMKRILTILIILAISNSIYADCLSGQIKNEEGEALPYASVFIASLNRGTTADIDGRFILDNIPAGNYDVTASFLGYKTDKMDIDVKGETRLDISLKEVAVTLEEFVVLPNGMDFATYIMTQVQKNIKPLGKRINTYDCYVEGKLHKKINLEKMPRKGLIRFAMMLLGYKKVFDIMTKYPELSIAVGMETHFAKGKVKGGDTKLLSYAPELTEKELKAVRNKDWFLDANAYDKFYEETNKKIKQLQSKKSKYKLAYHGSYEEGNRQVHILTYGRTRVEIVDGCWQIRRMQYKASTRTIYFEFQELYPNVYMPVSGHAQFNLDYAKFPKGEIGLSLSYDYGSVK